MIYYKRYTGKLLPQKTAEQPSWVQWTHHSEGKTHCEECLMLDGCWFQEENAQRNTAVQSNMHRKQSYDRD